MQTEVKGFDVFKLNKQILNAVKEKGFEQPTPIQLKAIPQILAGQDVIGIAQTGTGKTAAYLLPLIKMLSYAQGMNPRALIVLPTRELAAQVAESFKDFSKYTDLRCTIAIGATGAKKQIAEIEKGIDVIIATPGRLLELYSEGHLVLKKIEHFILDEAERLMDMSFMRQLYSVLEVLPRKRKHYLFSATMSELVKKIAHDFIEFPQIINIQPEQKTAVNVSQEIFFVPNLKTKIHLLDYFIKRTKMVGGDANHVEQDANHGGQDANHGQTSLSFGEGRGEVIKAQANEFSKLIVFCKSKEAANNIHKYFTRVYGDDFARLVHGNKTQQSRINAVKQFTEENIRMLVTTDVAARGIDISNVSHVINFDAPIIYEDYIHRIGRTGRAFATGHAITFVNEADEYHLKKIEKLIKQKIPVSQIPEEVFIEKTPYEEKQIMAREIDRQKRKDDPEYQGAFHQKKEPAKKPYIKPDKKRKPYYGKRKK
ncbi:MAG: DEAD/DEAH box helicase [Bacteroidia bacterium]